MKKAILLTLTMFSLNTFASSSVLTCSTSGFSLAKMTVESSGVVAITFTEADDEIPTEYKILSGLKDVQNKTSATLIAQSFEAAARPDGNTGGTVSDALLLRVLDGQKKAYLSIGGNVHKLICQ